MIMTTKEFEEWVAKTWKECQERAWASDSCEKTTPTEGLDNYQDPSIIGSMILGDEHD